MRNIAERLDASIASLLSDWTLLTTILALVLISLILYPIIFPAEPDTHPLLLARQSAIEPVRNKHESAVYRSPEVPPGAPLKSGLNVKAAGAARWTSGRDGDLRDIWREVQKGGQSDADGKEIPTGLIMTVLGKEELIEHSVEDLSREIGIIGRHLEESRCSRVAVYLPNNVEYLLSVFGMYSLQVSLRCDIADSWFRKHAPSTVSHPYYFLTICLIRRSTNCSSLPPRRASFAQQATYRSKTLPESVLTSVV